MNPRPTAWDADTLITNIAIPKGYKMQIDSIVHYNISVSIQISKMWNMSRGQHWSNLIWFQQNTICFDQAKQHCFLFEKVNRWINSRTGRSVFPKLNIQWKCIFKFAPILWQTWYIFIPPVASNSKREIRWIIISSWSYLKNKQTNKQKKQQHQQNLHVYKKEAYVYHKNVYLESVRFIIDWQTFYFSKSI